MPEDEPIVASAVVVPDAPAPPSPPHDNPPKRRQSSVSEAANKRPRLSIDDTANDASPNGAESKPTEPDRGTDRRRSRQLEERKRGQRLFGALLGTLSQSTSSAAQRRRADIEKKQQEKLKRQAEEFDQNKKERLEELDGIRRREQKKYDEQSMRIRHSNLIAMAHSLKTKTEPALYYLPWELRPEDEAMIKDQVEEAEAIVDKELDEFNRQRDAEREQAAARAEEEKNSDVAMEEADAEAKKKEPSSETVGAEEPTASEPPKSPPVEQDDSTNQATTTTTDADMTAVQEAKTTSPTQAEADEQASKEAELKNKEQQGDDNGEEVLEAEEDTVIY
ncbi:uncharacterized protein K452DRAFT_316920 [Aplosporella prunicola CBS 121167]|uniref:Pinin/SDK/MemA protein domain-containing protein n=1 Tax=Aplosporella prunicola CBS 121167 TaxID=1176127 RepID=A0A6A6BJJ1_9PEZI|nr:uncharacterized protein K452DRAFT_316920 [Aplosporella prunicola CBS 121167]KAF2144196.1 hypothetical protein K452DRAFT_316920 [Aplosporella prunicola CBS 121167]